MSHESHSLSVILPVYNGGDFLRPSIQSVLGQSLENFEFLILDDCSTDSSWEYIKSISDNRVTVYKNDVNKGLFESLNTLISHSNSPHIKIWSQDDIMYKNCLQSFFAFHQQNTSIGFSYCGRDIIDEKGMIKPIDNMDYTPSIISPDLHARIAFFTGSIAGNISNVCINRSVLNEVGVFDVGMKISADFDMWVRLARKHDTGFIREKLIQLRDHDGQLSRKEAYYINHVREDLIVYRNLLGYVKPHLKKEGKLLLRKYKLVYYYTLMVKSIARGKLKLAWQFLKELDSIDNLTLLSYSFIRSKIVRPPKPEFLNGEKS